MIVSNSLDRLAVSRINESSIDNSHCHTYGSGIYKRKAVYKNENKNENIVAGQDSKCILNVIKSEM